MNRKWRWAGVALLLLGAGPLRAQWEGPCTSCAPPCPGPAVSCYECYRPGPIRRLVRRVLGLPTTTCRPCYSCPPPVQVYYAPVAPAPYPVARPPVIVAPPRPVIVAPAPVVAPRAYEPAVAPPPAPVTGTMLRPERTITPPPPPSRPVRLESLASYRRG